MPEAQETFQTLVDRHKKILYKICNSYCRNPVDREDLAQEIVFQLWQSFRSFDGRVQFSTWMYRVALNVAISWYRRERTRTRHGSCKRIKAQAKGLLHNSGKCFRISVPGPAHES